MTIKMPVHVIRFILLDTFIRIHYDCIIVIQQSNVADGIMKIVKDKDIKGVTYDFVG